MSNQDLKTLYETQISLTEWFEKMGHEQTLSLREEDNTKHARLEVLHSLTDLPFNKSERFSAVDVIQPSLAFQELLTTRGNELCAVRLIPHDRELPKLRTRGVSILDGQIWTKAQQIDASKYSVDIVPHPTTSEWATIFIINDHGIFGEIIWGGHNQLTQGFYSKEKPITFSFDFSTWTIDDSRPDIKTYLTDLVSKIHIPDIEIQNKLQIELQAEFTQNHLVGYFETTSSAEFGTWFIDYNRLLGKKYSDYFLSATNSLDETTSILKGKTGTPGVAQGRVKIIDGKADLTSFTKGDILVTTMTTPIHLPLMRLAGGIITDIGGILSHAAIISRELGTPCIVGTNYGTTSLRDNDLVELDATKGIVRKIES